MSFAKPKKPKLPPPPPPPANAPTLADSRSAIGAGPVGSANINPSLISTSPGGLTSRATTRKRTLIGGV